MVARARGCDTGVEQGVAVRVWVVTEEWGYADIWHLRGVFSSLENAKAWVEARCPQLAPAHAWTEVQEGGVWLYAGYCVYRATVDGGLG
jgi:hypothetical protein